MYLSNIHIENFKGIKNADFDFDRTVNIIIGDNGTGKTSVLEAIVVALGGFLSGIDGVNTIHFSKDEIRRENQLTGRGSNNIVYKTPIRVDVCLELCVHNHGKTELHPFKFTRQKKSIKSVRSTVEPRDICREAQWMAEDRQAVLPVISYQSFSRVSNQKKDKWENPFSKEDYSRAVGYVDCLEEAANEKMLANWCKKMEQVAWQQEETIPEYEIVKKTVSKFMQLMQEDGRIRVYYDKRTEELVYTNEEEILPVRMLSSGFRNLLGMVFDIAYRMAVLNPDLLENVVEMTPGIVLIDEIDLHLHPRWQWKIIDALKNTFPRVQFIVTTHSPVIIASCKEEKLITLQLEDIFLDKPSEIMHGKTVKGWMVDRVLTEHMRTENRDPETTEKLKHLSLLAKKKISGYMSDGEKEEYRRLIRELSSLLPEDDIAVEEAAFMSVDEILGNKE
ncbi:MAG: AAA family ATPase [Schaedlerella arabinosiphila]|nr:AAA family ATPase [Schaedlerella arabinosiphila]